MSLQWKLLRFLTAERVVSAGGGDDDAGESAPLFVARAGARAGAAAATPRSPHDALLARLARATDAAHASHAVRGVAALAGPRGALRVFRLPGTHAHRPGAFVGTGHDAVVAAVHVVHTPVEALVASVGLDAKGLSVKIWGFAPVAPGDPPVAPGRLVEELDDDDAAAVDAAAPHGFPPPQEALVCRATLRMHSDSQPCALAALPGADPRAPLQTVAVGFEDASVMLFSGDLLRERFTRMRVAQAAGEMRDARPVTFLAFCADRLLCVTEQSVAALHPVYDDQPARGGTGDGKGEKKGGAARDVAASAPAPGAVPKKYEREAFDSRGALEGHTVAHILRSNEIVVAREEALYFFNKDGRGQCLAFPSERSGTYIAAVGPYIVHATPPNSVVVYDVFTKVVAYRGNGDVRAAYTDEASRSTILVMSDLSVVRLDEVPLDTRINMLLSRGMYSSAIAMAKAEGSLEGESPSPLFTGAVRQYAQILMGKGEYDAAAEQLIATIGGAVEPSWVITRLVEQPGLRSGLRSYLEALHYAGHASFVHTRVLITCYRHDRARAAILQTAAASAKGPGVTQAPDEDRTTDDYIIKVLSDVKWSEKDVDTAIDICCDAGLYGVAENVARKRGRNVLLARTLVENLDDISAGLRLMRELPDREEAFRIAAVCGRKLLACAPKEFVSVAADLITGHDNGSSGSTSSRRLAKQSLGGVPGLHTASSSTSPSPSNFSSAETALSGVLQSTPRLVESSSTGNNGVNGTCDKSTAVAEMARLFVDRPRWLATLLETVVSRTSPSGAACDPTTVWTLLFEALARVDVDRAPGAPTGRSALKILQSRTAKMDMTTALTISERHGHGPCLEFVYEQLRMYRELAQLLRMSGDVQGMLRACRRHGKREPHLWLEAIRLFAPLAGESGAKDKASASDVKDRSDDEGRASGTDTAYGKEHKSRASDAVQGAPGVTTDIKEGLKEAMFALDASGLLSPVEIVEAVCTACPTGKWSLVQDYFEGVVGKLTARAEEDEAAAEAMRSEAVEVRAESTRLGEAVIVKPRFCGVCDDSLTLPSVHFFCNHSFHAACVPPAGSSVPLGADQSGGMGFGGILGGFSHENEEMEGTAWAEIECPRCAPDLDDMVFQRNAFEEKNSRHDEFYRMLRGTKREGGYDLIIDCLSRSPFL